ncbi:MAG: Gldg family protein [Marinifilaceae bacterium]|jgi:gliding-associated putative ABC transporter substrate-binding component GldG|nr:Gldg family protein [Marinifilaceae bacterium]
MNRKNLIIASVLIASIVLVVNLISKKLSFRIDLTDDNIYTLSKASYDILEDLDTPVTIKAYFSEQLPPNIIKVKTDLEDYLVEYANVSSDMVAYEIVSTNDDESEKEAMKSGLQPVMLNIREKDKITQKKAFLGLVIQSEKGKDVIPYISPSMSLEYTLTTSIKKVSNSDKPKLAFITGHGEPTMEKYNELNKNLSVLYDLTELRIEPNTKIDKNIKTLIVNATKDSIPEYEFAKYDEFLKNGGNIYIGINAVDGDFSKAQGIPVTTRLETWLAKKGIKVENKFVMDQKCNSVSVQRKQGYFSMSTQVRFPYLPIISNFSDHPITKGLENVALKFASPISYNGDSTNIFTPIMFSSKNSKIVSTPLYFDVNKKWSTSDFGQRDIPIAAALKLATGGKMVIVTDGDFALSEGRGRVNPDNINLAVNSIDWISDDTGLIQMRTKAITSRPIDEMEDSTKAFIKYLNLLLPIILLIIYGLVRYQMNRTKRKFLKIERYA